jgi:8-oxo-dGTP diphosphatase
VNAAEQGTGANSPRRYQVIPRTLIFLTSSNPTSGTREILLLKGAPTKRLWANRYNGIGGHIEVNEDIYAAALRELHEEAGIHPTQLTLRGVINIDTGRDEQGPRPGVMIFVFHGESPTRQLQATPEGEPAWLPIDALAAYALVDDLYELIPRVLAGGPLFFGHYSPDPTGQLQYRFSESAPTLGAESPAG